MNKVYKFLTTTISVCLLTAGLAFAQFPADQEIVIVEPGTATLETAINSDVDADGARINPNRVYQLKAGGIYLMSSKIMFGSATDTTSTLIIIGEEGGKKPMVLINPIDDGDSFTNEMRGSLTLKNVFWGATALNNTAKHTFEFFGDNHDVRVDNVVFENSANGNSFHMKKSHGVSNIIIKNSYFRDFTSESMAPWGGSVYYKSMGDAIDTLWVENTTVANSGLTFLGKSCPTNVTIFNHNTIINTPKYFYINEQNKEAYFTNNLFINCNWQGEDINMQLLQLQSQIDNGPLYAGIVNVMEIKPEVWQDANDGVVPANEDLKILISNNLHYTSPYLDEYYNSSPKSNIDWGKVPEGTEFPHPVTNIPPRWLNTTSKALIDDYAGVKEADNHVQVDPLLKTKGIKNETVAAEYIKMANMNYQVGEEGVEPDRELMAFGDLDPNTLPGVETEDGDGVSKITDFLEYFSYDAEIKSTIDGLPLGALHWWTGLMDNYDGKEGFAKVKNYYEDPENNSYTGLEDVSTATNISIYPNPANDFITISGNFQLDNAKLYTVQGRMVKQIDMKGDLGRTINVSNLTNGMYFIQVKSETGETSTSKFFKK
ncbi:MAG: T9SS type A sorting domain-containing protein [Prolixibacteraceae bacterium]|nr:T9SS type A sorting domain-containing protein [Prolixibacteraceae bacterium]